VALNQWPHYNNANNKGKFKGLLWSQLRRIKLQGFQLEKMMYQGMPVPREDHFQAICELGNSNIALLMVKTGSIPGGVESNYKVGNTPLIYAAFFGMKEVVTALLEAGANINSTNDDGATSLNAASECGHLDIARILLQHGAAVNQANKDGCTPLFMASQQGYLDITEILLQHGALLPSQ